MDDMKQAPYWGHTNIRHNHTCLGDLAPRICAPMF